ncbi:hypothetical protein MKW92_047881 [Papaver armeniacum]|nr:hypothetical protein MKW92_047881 [Papaver armeniacum]
MQFPAPQILSYGNISSVYGTPYVHSGNVSPAPGGLPGYFESVSTVFGVPHPWRSPYFESSAPTYQGTSLHEGRGGFIRRQH